MGIRTKIQDVGRSISSTAEVSYRTLVAALRLYYTQFKRFIRGSADAPDPYSLDLRSPVHRAVEVYVTGMWPGDLKEALPLEFANAEKADNLTAAAHKIWEWSNFARRRPKMLRSFALEGELILKAVSTKAARPQDSRVWFQAIPASTVTTFEEDARGNCEYLRIDVTKTRRTDDDETEDYVHTEIWDKAHGVRIWEHDKGEEASVRTLGAPDAEQSKRLDQMGLDFIPFARAMFRDVGEERGHNVFQHAVRKVDECNRFWTALHKAGARTGVLWALEMQQADASGRPLPTDISTSSSTIELGGEKFAKVYGTMRCLVPPIPFDALRAIGNDMVAELEKDLPELLYYRIVEGAGELAYETVRTMLAPCEARVKEARMNAEAALVKVHKMALHLGQALGIPGFGKDEIGTFDAGDFDHRMDPNRDVYPAGPLERASIEEKEAKVDQVRVEVYPRREVWRKRGYSEDEIVQMEQELSEQRQGESNLADVMVEAAQRNLDQGGGQSGVAEAEEGVEEGQEAA